MRVVFAGTPGAAVPSLRALADSRHEVVAAVTRPDAPVGRRRVLTASPVAEAATQLGIPVIRAARLDEDATSRIAATRPELGVVVAYGGLVREPLLSQPAHGWINLHFSLLPRWRGAAPVQRALIAGDRVTGASVFRLVPALDAGDVLAQVRHPVAPHATAGTLLDELADIGAALVARVVDDIADGTAVAHPQEGDPTLAPKLTSADGLLDWTAPATTVLDRFRGVTPEPGAHTTLEGARLKILRLRRPDGVAVLAPGRLRAVGDEILVGTGDEPLALDTVQPAGKGAMPAPAWFRGLRGDDPAVGT